MNEDLELFSLFDSVDKVRGFIIHHVYTNCACEVFKEKFKEAWKTIKRQEWNNAADGRFLRSLETDVFNFAGALDHDFESQRAKKLLDLLASGEVEQWDVSMWSFVWMHSKFSKECKLKSKNVEFIAFLEHVRIHRNEMGHVRQIRKTDEQYEAMVDQFLQLLDRFQNSFHLNKAALMKAPIEFFDGITRKNYGGEHHFIYIYIQLLIIWTQFKVSVSQILVMPRLRLSHQRTLRYRTL